MQGLHSASSQLILWLETNKEMVNCELKPIRQQGINFNTIVRCEGCLLKGTSLRKLLGRRRHTPTAGSANQLLVPFRMPHPKHKQKHI